MKEIMSIPDQYRIHDGSHMNNQKKSEHALTLEEKTSKDGQSSRRVTK